MFDFSPADGDDLTAGASAAPLGVSSPPLRNRDGDPAMRAVAPEELTHPLLLRAERPHHYPRPAAPPRREVRRGRRVIGPAVLTGDLVALLAAAVTVRPTLASGALFVLLILTVRAGQRQYRSRMTLSVLDDVPGAIVGTLAAAGMALALSVVLDGEDEPARALLLASVLFLAALFTVQSVIFAVATALRRRVGHGRRTLLVGVGRVGTTLAEALSQHPELGLLPVGFVDPEPATSIAPLGLPLLSAGLGDLADVIVDNDIDTAILAIEGGGAKSHVDPVITVHQTGCTILMVPSMFELHRDGPDVERVRGIPLLRLRPDPTTRPGWWIKRGVDIALALVALVLLLPILLVVSCAILVDSGRPVLFWQERIGLDGRPFQLCKFRTLRPEGRLESETLWNIGADPRLGRLSRLLRRTSVDELPQLWNILRGGMSLVGPRPERPVFVAKFAAEHELYWARHRVPAGLTGLAQVNGLRGDTSILERARYDNYYIANWSLWLDVKILLLTAREVLGGRGR